MSLVWAVPVVSAAIATVIVAAAGRPLADEAAGLVDAVRRLRELRGPLAAVRDQAAESAALAAAYRQRHGTDPGGTDGGATDVPTNGTEA